MTKTSQSFLLSSHHGELTGAFDNFHKYLVGSNNRCVLITNPLTNTANSSTFIFKDGELVNTIPRQKSTLKLLVDYYLSFKHGRKVNYDFAIGSNNFDTLLLILMRKFGINKSEVIYFASDFVINRFRLGLLNSVYNAIEKICLRNCTYVISNTRRAASARIKLGLKPNKSLVAPNTIDDIELIINKKHNRDNFLYSGHVDNEHGLLQFVEVNQHIIKSLTVVGQGDGLAKLRSFCDTRNISLTTLGTKSRTQLFEILRNFNGYGLAPYTMDNSKHAYYGFSLKIIEYLAHGVPVICSNTTEVSEDLKKNGLAIVYDKSTASNLDQMISTFDFNKFDDSYYQYVMQFNSNSVYKTLLTKMTGENI